MQFMMFKVALGEQGTQVKIVYKVIFKCNEFTATYIQVSSTFVLSIYIYIICLSAVDWTQPSFNWLFLNVDLKWPWPFCVSCLRLGQPEFEGPHPPQHLASLSWSQPALAPHLCAALHPRLWDCGGNCLWWVCFTPKYTIYNISQGHVMVLMHWTPDTDNLTYSFNFFFLNWI